MSDILRIAFTVSAVLTGVLLALDLIALLEFRYHITAWMRHQEEINRLLRMRVEKLERLDGAANSPPIPRTGCGECLTDEEREAVECGIQAIGLAPCDEKTLAFADTLRGLLERLGGDR